MKHGWPGQKAAGVGKSSGREGTTGNRLAAYYKAEIRNDGEEGIQERQAADLAGDC